MQSRNLSELEEEIEGPAGGGWLFGALNRSMSRSEGARDAVLARVASGRPALHTGEPSLDPSATRSVLGRLSARPPADARAELT